MAASFTSTVLEDGPRNLILLINIVGDGLGELTNALLVDRSTFAPTDGTKSRVDKVEGNLDGFSATLSFDATADLVFAALPADDLFSYDWWEEGGISSNKAGAGANGDILLTTVGTAANERGTFTIWIRKH